MAKMSIVSFPTEIQVMVLQRCQPDDFECLALSCKAFHGAAKPLIKEHNKRRKYRSFKFPSCYSYQRDPKDIASVPELLAAIALEPEIAQYIVHLDLDHRDKLDWHQSAVDRFEAGRDALHKLLSESTYLKEIDSSSEYIDEWRTRLRVGDAGNQYNEESVDYDAALLLTLLPNLESLKLTASWTPQTVDFVGQGEDPVQDTFSLRIRDLVQLIVKRANDDSLHGQSLSKLHTLHDMSGVDGQSGVDMVCILPFLALNSLRHATHHFGFATTSGVNWYPQSDDDNQSNASGSDGAENNDKDSSMHVDDKQDEEHEEDEDDNNSQHSSNHSAKGSEPGGGEARKDWLERHANAFISPRYPVLGVNVETLSFTECVIDSDAITVFLRNMRNLKKLHFNYTMFDEYGDDWNIDGFMMGIMHTVGDNLEDLDISCGQVNPNSELLGSELDGFKVLKELGIPTTLFVNNAEWCGWDDENDWDDPAGPIVEILPKSLESFGLFVPCADYECLVNLFRRWKMKREKMLPSLKDATLQVGRRDCWGNKFKDYERKEKIIALLAEDYGVEAHFEGNLLSPEAESNDD